MKKPFHKETGYLIKDIKSGEIDTESRYPESHFTANNTPLVDGYEWVEVELAYTEVGTL